VFIPQSVRVEFETLRTTSDLLSNLRSLERLGDWIDDMKVFVASEAKASGRTLHEIGAVQDRPRQAVHRKLKSGQSHGFTHPDFDGVNSSTLRYWLDWWSDPARRKNGKEENGRDPKSEAARIMAELEARYDAGILRKPAGGLKERGIDG
jgi:transposase-like protein